MHKFEMFGVLKMGLEGFDGCSVAEASSDESHFKLSDMATSGRLLVHCIV